MGETPTRQRAIFLKPEPELAVRIDVEAARRRMSAPKLIMALLDQQLPTVGKQEVSA